MDRVNSSYDLEYDYYRKNLPAIDDSEETEESMKLYEEIFESRKTFTVLNLDSYITITKKSLNRIAKMIKFHDFVYRTSSNWYEDKFDKLLEKENGQLNPIFVPENDDEKWLI